MKKVLLICILLFSLLFSSCKPDTLSGENDVPRADDSSFGEPLEDIGAYDGYFEGESVDFTVSCLSGTDGAYRVDGDTLYFTAIGVDSAYSLEGRFKGNIVIDTGDLHKFDLELHGFSLVSTDSAPISVKSGSEVAIKAKKDTKNYIYDKRTADSAGEQVTEKAAVCSEVDLEISGKGILFVVSESFGGIRTKDDLQVKNLTLTVAASDDALRGNDSVELTDATTTLISVLSDGIKTENSDVSEKGNQRGNVSISGGVHCIYAACDGIDSAYDVTVEGDITQLFIYTDKYSNYSGEITAVSDAKYYIRFQSDYYAYSIKFLSSDGGECEWVDAEYHSMVDAGRSRYYYYSFDKPEGFDKMQFFVYTPDQPLRGETDYAAASDIMTVSEAYDTIALTSSGYSWTNYTTSIDGGGFGGPGGGPGGPGGGPGGMQDGNIEKSDRSTKGLKAANEIFIMSGALNIKSYDDAIHANGGAALENGTTGAGNVSIFGGEISVFSNDDGVHADNILLISGGSLEITNSYEGIEGAYVSIEGGTVSIVSRDDGVNATATAGSSLTLAGGTLYVYCGGDGLDSNSRTSYQGIVFSGGTAVIISTSGGNCCIDSEQGYSYTGGKVVAIMPRGGMTSEAVQAINFESVGSISQINLRAGHYLTISGVVNATIEIPVDMNAYVIVLGDNSPDITTSSESSLTLDNNGVSFEQIDG